MLPLDQAWYRRLIGLAALLGLVAGLLGMLYLAGTGAATDLVFGDPRISAWSGDWWWIPLTAIGGVAVTALRRRWRVPARVPSGVETIESGRVDHATAPSWLAIAAVSAVTSASLGPSFSLVIAGGALGSWLAARRWIDDEARLDYTLTGMAGGLGGAFTSPILGMFMVTELAPIPRQRYLAALIPQLIAATIGFGLYYAIAGRTFLGIYGLPPYEFSLWHIGVAVILGSVASLIMGVFALILLAVRFVAVLVGSDYAWGLTGGAIVGLIAAVLPLTLGAGSVQLDTVIDESTEISVWLLVAVLLGKILAMAVSLSSGFIGGNVFPMIFVGGTAGTVVTSPSPTCPPPWQSRR